MKKIIFQKPGLAAEERMVLRANLHTHTTNSDGQFTPEQIIDMYSKKGYDVLNFSDHEVLNKVSTYDGKGMTLISGIELHPFSHRGSRWHILAIGVPEDFPHTHPATGQEAVDLAAAAGAAVFCAHPYWCGFTSDDVMTLKNILGIEVYNTSTRYIGKDYDMFCWDCCLDAGKEYTAIAVDDIHRMWDFAYGWTMICAESNSQEDIMNALKQGYFYASQGPEFYKIAVHDGILDLEFSPCAAAILVGRESRGVCLCIESNTEPSEGMTSQKIDLKDCPRGLFRIQLRDANGKFAWSNPIRNPYC